MIFEEYRPCKTTSIINRPTMICYLFSAAAEVYVLLDISLSTCEYLQREYNNEKFAFDVLTAVTNGKSSLLQCNAV
jgi:hypothetical protein